MITAIPLLITTTILIFVVIYLLIKIKNNNNTIKKISDQEKNKLIGVISSLTDGVIVLDNKLTPWAVNDAARSFLSITKESPLFVDISNAFNKELNLEEKLKEVISFDRIVTLHEVFINNRTFQVYINPVGGKNENEINQSQDIIGVSILLQDITAEKSVDKMKEEFSHSVVHELRAPITAIKDSASLMLADGLSDEEEKKMLTLIHDQSKKLLMQISTILDAAKVESGKLVLTKTLGDLGKLAQDEVNLFLPEAKKKSITIIAEIGKNLPQIPFDNIRISQAITNVISNSLKYTNPNGVIKITVDTDEEFEKTGSNGSMKITITDNGIGIPPEKQHMLFTKFGQLNSNASQETQAVSSGLGLYITKGIIEAHGGKIEIQSEIGQGTTTTLYLPINPENKLS